ncbi:MAG: hypothetical protein JSV04_06490 [Candidatus Heimdallarchaeota archaeon]|nr:MAG: hypothetical protein JSV04_06490 [Candidatus Heimdallarchaeota archaeon]
MSSENYNNGSSTSLSIFYGKKNTPLIQSQLLSISLEPERTHSPPENTSKISSTDSIPQVNSTSTQIGKDKSLKQHSQVCIPQPLSSFYSEIREFTEKTAEIKKSPKKAKRRSSATKQLLLNGLSETKQRLSAKTDQQLSDKQLKSKKRRKTILHRNEKNFIGLNQFIAEKRIEVKRKSDSVAEKSTQIITDEKVQHKIPLLIDEDPFPFTTLTEWLIWHDNFPELAYVREAYALEEIPDEDVEVFWVNIMNDPEFFSPDWRIMGTNIDINTVKEHGRPMWTPEWDIMSSNTEGFSIFFRDVYQILSSVPQGIQNFRYPILQFALKGLLLLDLASFDVTTQKWSSKGTIEDLTIRLEALDIFVSQQEDLSSYYQNLRSMMVKDEWQVGLILYDLLIHQSTYLKIFSKNLIEEKTKLEQIFKENYLQRIIKKLKVIEQIDKMGVRRLLKEMDALETN